MQLDSPSYPLAEVVVVVDPHPGPFLRQLSAWSASASAHPGRTPEEVPFKQAAAQEPRRAAAAGEAAALQNPDQADATSAQQSHYGSTADDQLEATGCDRSSRSSGNSGSSSSSSCSSSGSCSSSCQQQPEALQPLLTELRKLQELGWVDRVVVADSAGSSAVSAVNQRFFGLLDCKATHSSSGASTTPTLQGFEACEHDLVLQLDVDLLLAGRPYQQSMGQAGSSSSSSSGSAGRSGSTGSNPSTLQQMVDVLTRDPSAVSVSLPTLPTPPSSVSGLAGGDSPGLTHAFIARRGLSELTTSTASRAVFSASYISPAGQPWRTEVRGCLIHRERLLQLLPLPTPPRPSLAEPQALMGGAAGPAQQCSSDASSTRCAVDGGPPVAGTAGSSSRSSGASSSSSRPPAWHRALDAAVLASSGRLHTYRPHYRTHAAAAADSTGSCGSNKAAGAIATSSSGSSNISSPLCLQPAPDLCFLHPPNQPLKESPWGLSLVTSALRSSTWPVQQRGRVRCMNGSLADVAYGDPVGLVTRFNCATNGLLSLSVDCHSSA